MARKPYPFVQIALTLDVAQDGRTVPVVLTNEGNKGDERGTMPTAESNLRPTEQELVERWRAEELERAGYPAELAGELAMRTDVDLHHAAELLVKGCSPELAAQILL